MNWRVAILSSVLSAVVAVAAPPQVATDQSGPQDEKLDLIARLTKPWDRVNRWLIEYEASAVISQGDAIPVHKIMAVAEPGDFYHLVAHLPPTNPWQHDPFAQELEIHSGIIRQSWRFNRTFSEKPIHAGEVIPGTTSMDVLLPILPRWPLTTYKIAVSPLSGAPVVLVDAFRSPDFRLLPEPELVLGKSCAVLDFKGVEKMWVATNNGLTLMKRELRDPSTKLLLSRLSTEKVIEPMPGAFLPSEFRYQYYRPGRSTNKSSNEEHGDHQHKDVEGLDVEEEIVVRILRCEVNASVPDSTFDFHYPAGALRYQDNANFTQVVAGGEDLLTDITDFMVKYAKLPSKGSAKPIHLRWGVIGFLAGATVSMLPSRRGNLPGVTRQ